MQQMKDTCERNVLELQAKIQEKEQESAALST